MHSFTNANKSFREYAKHEIPAVAELINTEDTYINALANVINGYMSQFFKENNEIPVPEDLKQHDVQLIFGNIIEIYEWHKHYFFEALKSNYRSIRGLSNVFIQNERQFHIYAKYINNKSISEYLINTHLDYFDQIKKRLNCPNSIGDLMIAPVQRVARYKMLLEEILKHQTKKGSRENVDHLNDALIIVKRVCNEVNEFADLIGIQNFDGLVSDQGKILHRGFLKCNYEGERHNWYIFIFERSILFTKRTEPKKKFTIATYNTCLQIPMNKLQLRELQNKQFLLQRMDPNAPECSLICKALTNEDHTQWIQVLRQQLALQMNLIQDLVNPCPEEDGQREILL